MRVNRSTTRNDVFVYNQLNNKVDDGAKGSVSRGKSATVYRARLRLRGTRDKIVAVKKWNYNFKDSVNVKLSKVKESFYEEVAVLKRLVHRNIVRYIGKCDENDNLCLITEWLPSGNLFTFLSEPTHQLSAWETANMALDIAHGMEYLHMNKILHRDLKLHNLLLNQNKRVKIADFGSSIVLSEEKQKVRGNFGTFGFIAPEVYEEKEYAEKSDVFSYGICIWQIITKSASNPFRNEDDYYSKVTAEEFPASVKLACEKAGCTPALARIVRDCCNYIPENRPLFSDIVKSLEKAFPLHSYNTRSKQGVIAPSIEEQELL